MIMNMDLIIPVLRHLGTNKPYKPTAARIMKACREPAQ